MKHSVFVSVKDVIWHLIISSRVKHSVFVSVKDIIWRLIIRDLL